MGRRLRILHLMNASDAGGLSRYVVELAVATKAAGHQVAVAGEHGEWKGKFEQRGVEWLEVPVRSGITGPWKGSKVLKQWLESDGARGAWRGGIDLFHSHYRRPTWMARFLQKKDGNGNRRPPVLYTLHLSDLKVTGLNKYLSDWGDHTHVPSEEGAEWLRVKANVAADQITLIPHGVDATKWPLTTLALRQKARAEFKLGEGELVACYVGRLDQDHPKNVHWVLEVAKRVPEVKVLIAGDGPDEKRIRDLVESMGLSDRVTMLGEREPKSVYAASDLLLLPSGREGFSLACAEAMSCGVAVLRTRTAGTKELIVEGETGRSVVVDEGLFVKAAEEMLKERGKLRHMGLAGSKRVREKFTFERQVKETVELYERLVGG